MNAIFGDAELTTEHPQSSYNRPVLVVDGQALGPEDLIGTHMAGSVMVCSDAVTMGVMATDVLNAVCAWLSQSALHGERWTAAVRRAQMWEGGKQ